MSRERKDWNARLLQNAEPTTVRHRRRSAVLGLTILAVLITMVGLFADVQLGAGWLANACYVAALIASTVLLAFLYSKRLRVTRRPGDRP